MKRIEVKGEAAHPFVHGRIDFIQLMLFPDCGETRPRVQVSQHVIPWDQKAVSGRLQAQKGSLRTKLFESCCGRDLEGEQVNIPPLRDTLEPSEKSRIHV